MYLLGTILTLTLLLWVTIEHSIMKNNATTKVLGGMFNHFKDMNEQVIEFRTTKEKALRGKREFEVKTIRRNLYKVSMKGVQVCDIEEIPVMTIDKEKA